MKYLTKEWYAKMQRTDLYFGLQISKKAEEYSDNYYQTLYNKAQKRHIKDFSDFTSYKKIKKIFLENIDDNSNLTDKDIEREFKNLNKEMFFGMSIEENFDYRQKQIIERLKTDIPEEILNKVKDIRVLALGYVSSEVYKLLKEYCDINEKFVEEKFREYERIESEQFKNEAIGFLEESFHDCFVIDINKEKNNLVIQLDNNHSFTNKTNIVFQNYNTILDENINKSWWLYEEVYKNNDRYEVHILTSGDMGLKELIVDCDDIILS